MIRTYEVNVPAGGSTGIPSATGNYIRCLDSSGAEFVLHLDSKGGSTRFPWEGGLGFETRPFHGVRIESKNGVGGQVKIIVSDEGAVHDSRLVVTGTLQTRVAGAQSATVKPLQTLTVVDQAYEVLPTLANRKQATVQINEDCYIGNKADGILISGGLVWEATTPLTLIPVRVPCEVRILEEAN